MIRVLILDDEPSYREYLQRYLTREGYSVRAAATGSEAVEIGREFMPDIILADWMLKDQMHGLQASVTLRTDHPSLQILMMTGFPSSEIRLEAEQAKVFRFLEKPFGLEELREAIEAAASSVGTHSPL